MTQQVAEAAWPLKISVHDHPVVGREGGASLQDRRRQSGRISPLDSL